MPAKHAICSIEGCTGTVKAKGWCNTHYCRWRVGGDPLKVSFIRGNPTANFQRKVNRDGPVPASRPELGPCWLWTGRTAKGGYGHTLFDGRLRYAHVIAWFLASGSWPDGLSVCHHCDVPACVNPAHLFLGTHQDNMADMMAKGRQAIGERSGRAKLSASDVRAAREARAEGATQVALASRYGISRRAMRAILDGTNWKSV